MAARYLNLEGMYEITQGGSFVTYGDINVDSFSWKSYDKSLETNSFGLQELKFNLSDVTF